MPDQLPTLHSIACSGRAEQTRRHLEEAARRQEEERRAAEAQARQKRVQYKAGRLTDEERAAKLAAMSSAAEEHDHERTARVRSQVAREEKVESTVAARTADSAAAFLEAAQRETLAATGAKGMSLEEAVNRRKHFQQRGAAASGAGFRR